MGVEFEESEQGQEKAETGRSRRQSPIEVELKQALAVCIERGSSIGDEELRNASFDIFDESELPMFQPRIGVFGAPKCRFTTSVIALLSITIGMVLTTSGACILIFFVEQEPTILPLGLTLGFLGLVMFVIGGIMWVSEFMCNDCLGKAYEKMKEAPLKNALERRSRMASRTTTRTGSRLSNLSQISYLTTASKNTVSTKY